jgi:hypothetical protein
MTQKMLTYWVEILLSNGTINEVLSDYNYNWQYVKDYYLSYSTSAMVITPRRGVNNHPFVHESDNLDYTMPDYNPNFNKTFGEVSDETALSALKSLPENKKLMIHWSGGLDSTVALIAVLKNWSKHDLQEKLVVNMNNYSIFESPNIYYNFIKDQIQTTNSYNIPDFDKYVTVYGEPEMPSTSSKKYLSLIKEHKGIYDMPLQENIGLYIDHYTRRINKNFAETNAEKLLENIDSVGDLYPIETIADLIWWENYNWAWKGCMGVDWYMKHYQGLDPELYINNHINWYNTPNYQQWLMKNKGHGVSYGRDLSFTKRSHKEYIYEFDKNLFYKEFKSKLPGQFWAIDQDVDGKVCMITDDFKQLSIRDNLNEIKSLIPKILNVS